MYFAEVVSLQTIKDRKWSESSSEYKKTTKKNTWPQSSSVFTYWPYYVAIVLPTVLLKRLYPISAYWCIKEPVINRQTTFSLLGAQVKPDGKLCLLCIIFSMKSITCSKHWNETTMTLYKFPNLKFLSVIASEGASWNVCLVDGKNRVKRGSLQLPSGHAPSSLGATSVHRSAILNLRDSHACCWQAPQGQAVLC